VIDCYAVTPEMLRQMEIWRTTKGSPLTASQLRGWLVANGAKLDRDDGPAYVATFPHGTRIERYYRDGMLDRADGPARIETYTDGTRIEKYYRADKFIKEEAIPRQDSDGHSGVKILKPPLTPVKPPSASLGPPPNPAP
jgi:hypothetical protein